MKNYTFALTVILLSPVTVAAAREDAPPEKIGQIIYVSPHGDDSWSGTLAEPDARRSDGPLATISRARDEIREIKKQSGTLTTPIVVMIRGGTYFLDRPLVFTSEDSGTSTRPITYQAYADEKPILSGGRSIGRFNEDAGNLWATEIPQVKAGRWYFHQLFVNGRRRPRARIPNRGYLRTQRTLHNCFYYQGGDLRRWTNFEDVSIVLMHLWESSVHFIDELNEQKRLARLSPLIPWGGFYPPWEKQQRYYVENVFEGLDAPGEWYLNRTTGVLYYHPLPGEDVHSAEVIAPVLPATLVEFQGRPQQGQFVEHLHFDGLSFQHTEAGLSRSVKNGPQGAAPQHAAIMATGLRHGSFRQCEIAHVGEHAIWLRTGSQDNRIVQCHLHDLGAGGIRIGEGTTPSSESEATLRNTIDNNLIHDGARLFHGGAGIYIARSSYNILTHNDLSDFEWVGIAVGWQWGYQPTTAHHNSIEFNHVHHIGHGALADMGAIYTLGVSPGTTVRNNLIHDVKAYPKYYNKELATGGGFAPDEANGIYPDEGTSGVLYENNVVYNISGRCFGVNYCRDNIVRNNIFALAPHGFGINISDAGHVQFDAQRNIVHCTSPNVLYGAWLGKQIMDHNLYWTTSGKELEFAGRTLAQWQEEGHDRKSIVADPLFVDMARGDLRLQNNSPAAKIGFKPIDVDAIGLYGDPDWVELGKTITHREDDPPAPPRLPETIDDDFEDSLLGHYPVRATRICRGGTSIVVTDETAAGSKQCLKFSDLAGVKEVFSPHMEYQPNFASGRLEFSCHLKNTRDAPAAVLIEMRDWRQNPYRVGPTVSFMPDGKCSAAGRPLTNVPPDEWVHLRIRLALGKDAPKTYQLQLAVPGQEPQTLTLPFSSQDFEVLTWLGISGVGDTAAVFYVDDVRLKERLNR